MEDPRVGIQQRLERAWSYNRWIGDQARAVVGRRMLDAGAGAGNITDLLVDRDQVVCVDVWPEFTTLLGEKYKSDGHVAVVESDLADPALPERLAPFELDSAICVNVLEHVEDHVAALRNIAAVLPSGGALFLLVPAFPSIYGSMDAADHHFRRYTKSSLRAAVAELPFEVERLRYMNLPGYFAWFLVGRVLRRELLNEGSYGIYDRIVPFVRAVESRIDPPFGQSLVAVLRRH